MVTERQKSHPRPPQKPHYGYDAIYMLNLSRNALKRVVRSEGKRREGGLIGSRKKINKKESAGISLLRKIFPLYCGADVFLFTLRCPGLRIGRSSACL